MSLLRPRKKVIKKTKADLYNEPNTDKECIRCEDCGRKNYLYNYKETFKDVWLCRECGRKRLYGKYYTDDWKTDPEIQKACREYDLRYYGQEYCRTHRRI